MAYLERSGGKSWLRECGVDEATIEQIRMTGQTSIPTGGFTDGRMTLRNILRTWQARAAGGSGYVCGVTGRGEAKSLSRVLVTVDGRTLKIVLLKMQGYS